MKNTTAQPRICKKCEERIHELARGSTGRFALKRCDHLGGIVMAVAFVAERRVVSWHLEGPLKEHEADVVLGRIAAMYAAAGGYEAPKVQ